MIEFSDLQGQTIFKLEGLENESETVIFYTSSNIYKMYYVPTCCETVRIIDLDGDVKDMLYTPILLAEEVNNVNCVEENDRIYDDSYTWTFYKLRTIKGSMTIRWLGESNGYYAETPNFKEVE